MTAQTQDVQRIHYPPRPLGIVYCTRCFARTEHWSDGEPPSLPADQCHWWCLFCVQNDDPGYRPYRPGQLSAEVIAKGKARLMDRGLELAFAAGNVDPAALKRSIEKGRPW